MKKPYKHPPASKQALKDGCTCPVLDNHHGEGSGYFDDEGNPVFWFSFDCLLHGDLESLPSETKL